MLRTSLALAAVAVLVLVAPSSGSGGPNAVHPVTVGETRLPPAPVQAMERRIEAAWLRDESRVLGLPPGDGLRGRVADALAGPRGRGIPAAFARYHERHRAATRCLAGATDPYADRCVNRPAAPDGACRWMGEASLCRVAAGSRRLWLVVHRSGSRRFRVRAPAVAALRRIYLRAREGRARAARNERAARALRRLRAERARAAAERRRLAAEQRAERRRRAAARRAERRRVAAERRARLADPRLAAASLPRARRACALYRRAAEPYAFGLGMQDPAGQADGLLAARAAFRGRLRRAAADRIDLGKLRPLLGARSADGALHRLRAAPDVDRLFRALSDYEAAVRREARLAARLGLPDCAG